MGVEFLRSAGAQRYVESLLPEEREAVQASEAIIVGLIVAGVDLGGIDLPVEGSRTALVAKVEKLHESHYRVRVEHIGDEALAGRRGLSRRVMTREMRWQSWREALGRGQTYPQEASTSARSEASGRD